MGPMRFSALDLAILLTCAVISGVSARDYAGGYNDGSRLASVESLVDYHTWQIDRSIFFDYGEGIHPDVWGPSIETSLPRSLDKLRIGGHFYSDKPPVTALFMAGIYQVLQWTTGLTARDHPRAFCYWMTLTTSGLAYVIAVWCVYRAGALLGLPIGKALLLASSFGLATLAPAYARQVNASIVLMAISAALLLVMLKGSESRRPSSWKVALGAGFLAGLGYSTDLGSGPVLILCTALWVFGTSGYRVLPVILFGVGALPWLVGHHSLNYWIGGTLGPMSTVPEYFDWPNSPFSEKNLTGVGSGHVSFASFVGYASRFLFGNKGFLYHNLELFLAIPAFFWLVKRARGLRPVLLAFGAWAVGTWLLYAVKSKDYSGYNVSIRWMVPTLVAGYLVLGAQLRESRDSLRDFILLTLFAVPIAAYDWSIGTWTDSRIRYFHVYVAVALVCWLASSLSRTGWLSIRPFSRPEPATGRVNQANLK